MTRRIAQRSALLVSTVVLLLSSGYARADEVDTVALLDQLRSDSTPGNASRALRELDPKWGGGRRKLREMIDRLKVMAKDPDPQMRQYASYLLVEADPKILAPESPWRSDLLGLFAGGLPADDISHNASHALRVFHRLILGDNPADIRDLLTPLLTNPDYQARQLATYLMVLSYREAGIPESEWCPVVYENMVLGLRDDAIRGRRGGITNASTFFHFLFDLKENRPVNLLRSELAGKDTQSQYAAAVLLARWRDLQSGHTIRSLLMPHLVDDGGRDSRYALPAYEALVSYGREHTVELLREFHAIDWQDGALVVCAAAFHGLSPSFVTDTHRQEWLSRIQEYESATPARRSRQHSDAKIAAAALYLDPRAASFLSGTRIPAYLQRMFEAGEGVAELAERAKWMASWFPMLDPYRPRRASFVISMGNAKRGPGSRNPE